MAQNRRGKGPNLLKVGKSNQKAGKEGQKQGGKWQQQKVAQTGLKKRPNASAKKSLHRSASPHIEPHLLASKIPVFPCIALHRRTCLPVWRGGAAVAGAVAAPWAAQPVPQPAEGMAVDGLGGMTIRTSAGSK